MSWHGRSMVPGWPGAGPSLPCPCARLDRPACPPGTPSGAASWHASQPGAAACTGSPDPSRNSWGRPFCAVRGWSRTLAAPSIRRRSVGAFETCSTRYPWPRRQLIVGSDGKTTLIQPRASDVRKMPDKRAQSSFPRVLSLRTNRGALARFTHMTTLRTMKRQHCLKVNNAATGLQCGGSSGGRTALPCLPRAIIDNRTDHRDTALRLWRR